MSAYQQQAQANLSHYLKPVWLLLGAVLLTCANAYGKPRKLTAIVEYARFRVDTATTMLELYLDIDAKTVVFVPTKAKKGNQTFSGGAVLELEVWQGGRQVHIDRLNVVSPAMADTNNLDFALSMVARCIVPSKPSEIRLRLKQVNQQFGDTASVMLSLPLDLATLKPTDKPLISDIQMVREAAQSNKQDDLVKSGIKLTPYPSDFYPAAVSSIKCYQELYDLNKYMSDTSIGALSFRIIKLPTFEVLETWGAVMRIKPKEVIPVYKEIDISELPSGHYRLQLAILNSEGKIMGLRDKSFYRSNPTHDQDKTTSLLTAKVVTAGTFVDSIKGRNIKQYVYHIKAIATRPEAGTIDILVASTDYAAMRSFYLEFWQRRDKDQAYEMHKDYREKALEAQSRFGSRSRPLLESDRARVFLKYGLPNQIFNEQTDNGRQANANSNMTYELWQYYSLEATKQSSVEFVFVRDMASSQFVLVHSNAAGERRNDNWRMGQFSTTR